MAPRSARSSGTQWASFIADGARCTTLALDLNQRPRSPAVKVGKSIELSYVYLFWLRALIHRASPPIHALSRPRNPNVLPLPPPHTTEHVVLRPNATSHDALLLVLIPATTCNRHHLWPMKPCPALTTSHRSPPLHTSSRPCEKDVHEGYQKSLLPLVTKPLLVLIFRPSRRLSSFSRPLSETEMPPRLAFLTAGVLRTR